MTEHNQLAGVHYHHDNAGIVTLSFEHVGGSEGVSAELCFYETLPRLVERLQAARKNGSERGQVRGVILALGTGRTYAGTDIAALLRFSPEHAVQQQPQLDGMKAALRALEQLGVPVVAVMNDGAQGTWLEIALAAHYRVAAAAPGKSVGVPEVSLGLLPGGGGLTRLVRMLGLQRALAEVILPARHFTLPEAQELGLIDEIVPAVDDLDAAARAYILSHESAQQPWDRPGYSLPGGDPRSASGMAMLPMLPAKLRQQLKGAPLPAPRAALAAAVEGAHVDFDTASLIETRYFVQLANGQVAKNMLLSKGIQLEELSRGASRPAEIPAALPTRVAVIGAGMMGAGIAYAAAEAGFAVVLKDLSAELTERGKEHSRTLVARELAAGRVTAEAAEQLLARITPTDAYADLRGVDLVIEAVFEDLALKQAVFAEAVRYVTPHAILGSNTSTIPITQLAEGIAPAVGAVQAGQATETATATTTEVAQAARVIGIHFFSPVDKMKLVEIIRGAETSDETLARVFDFVLAIGKIPIVVNDSRGFFTSRVIGRFLEEAMAMLADGISPVSIEQAALQAGYPAGPLQLLDELSLTLWQRITAETREAALANGQGWHPHVSEVVNNRMVELGRAGRRAGGGFYDYDDAGRRIGLWSGLSTLAAHSAERTPGEIVTGETVTEEIATDTRTGERTADLEITFRDMQERMLFAEALDAIRCLEEGVITAVADANIGSILGIGYPSWTGGVLQYAQQYAGGLHGFLERARELEARFGSRFTPPALLVECVAQGSALRPPSNVSGAR